VAGGNALATFKMDGLMPLIDLAGADGAISAAQLDQLILEAKTRGVSETDARAYLTKYAASRGSQLGAPAGSNRARRRAASTPAAPSLPQPQAVSFSGPAISQPTPDRTFRWIAASVVGLFVIAIIVVVTRVKEHPQLPPLQPAITPVPAPAPAAPAPQTTPSPDVPRQQQADREQRAYNAARGNIPALQVYLNTCTVCSFAPDARSEIGKLQTADQEERTYNSSRGNKYALQAYVNNCTICSYGSAARSEIAALEAAQPKRLASSTLLCGRSVDYVVDATGVADSFRPFLGVWTGASWNSRICGALIISRVENDGTARITYIYGPLPGGNFPWKQQSPAAAIDYSQLKFQDEEAGNFVFRLSQQNILQGHFVSSRGVTLDAVLTRDLSSVPQ
jgi:hypothetical protein